MSVANLPTQTVDLNTPLLGEEVTLNGEKFKVLRVKVAVGAAGTDGGNLAQAAGGGPATIADGANVVEGSLADAAVTTDIAGTINAKLRGLIKLLIGTTATLLNVGGTVADAATDSGNPVKIGGQANNPDSLPAAATAGQRVNLVTDLSRRLIVYLGTKLDYINDSITAMLLPIGNSQAVAVTTSGAYVAGDGIGGIISLATVNYSTGKSVRLKSVCIKDKGANNLPLQLYFFKATPSAGTYTDNAALAWGTGDAANMVGCLNVLAGDWMTIGADSFVTYSGLDMDMAVSATTLFMLIAAPAGSAPTFANGDLSLELSFDQKQ